MPTPDFPGEKPVLVNDYLHTLDFTGEKPTTVSLNKEIPTPVKQKDPGSRMLPPSSIPTSSSDQTFNAPEGNTPKGT